MMTEQLKSFFSILNTKVDFVNNVKKDYSKLLASDFNSLDFFKFGENKASEIIAFFLDPNESHGQGDLYLNLFLVELGIDFRYDKFTDVISVVEKNTDDRRRIDIFVKSKSHKTLFGIENKIYVSTADQLNQINDYLEFLDKQAIDHDFTLFYLAPRGKTVSTLSFNEDLLNQKYSADCLKFITYEDDMIPLIHEFGLRTENNRVQAFLFDFERKLQKLYMGNSEINETQIVRDFMCESSTNLETSFAITNNIGAVKSELLRNFDQQMKEISAELNIQLDADPYRFTLEKLKNFKVGVSFEEGGVFYGIVRTAEVLEKKRLLEIEMLFPYNIESTKWWPIYIWGFKDIESNFSFWQAIIDGSIKKQIKEFILVLLNSSYSLKEV